MAIEVRNFTPFPFLQFSNTDKKGKEFGVLMVKCAWEIQKDGEMGPALEQEPFVFTDIYQDKCNSSSLIYPSDFVAYKPETDIILNAISYAPNRTASSLWQAEIKILSDNKIKIQKKIQITGPRHWIPKWKRELSDQEKNNWKQHRNLFIGWELSKPEPITSLPICYEYSYGGFIQKYNDENKDVSIEAYEYNPIGRGLIDPEWTDHTKSVPAPQIEDPDDPISDPYKKYKPISLGAIPPSWLPRRLLAGTFDKNWVQNVAPNWPADYDFKYNSSSSSGMKTNNEYLDNFFELYLTNLSKDDFLKLYYKECIFIYANCKNKNDEFYRLKLNLDTFFCDTNSENNELTIYSLYRSVFNLEEFTSIDIYCFPATEKLSKIFNNSFFCKDKKPDDVSIIMKL